MIFNIGINIKMGNNESTSTGRSRVIGITNHGDHVSLGQILDKHKDLENIINYCRIFNDHHMKPPNGEIDYEAEVMYAKKLVAVITPYSPRDLEIPKFDEKPPAFGETISRVNKHDYEKYIVRVLEYVAVILSLIKLVPV